MWAIFIVFKFIIINVCVFVPVSKKRDPPESIQNIQNRLLDPYYQGWKSVTPKSLLDNCYRTMLCLFKECFSNEDDNYDCKLMELAFCFYICVTVEYWSAKHWLAKRPTESIQQTQTTFFFLKIGIFFGNDGTDLLTGVLRFWGKTVEVHLMIATIWFGEFWSQTTRRVLPPVHQIFVDNLTQPQNVCTR